ncbi:PREDICTED: uncharacterized protein LOC105448055 [Wasmannia auropunctata]|uniref:uncharacterized protein LOC105448055 n=1 Tax=Wasmannia auropunctata TaxID=64793 RepID=UPI0005F0B499|nr:PREDICTED: uncharacterized protein LOC105448055 [Wasmannia auropunctata]
MTRSRSASRSNVLENHTDYSLQLNRWYLIPIGAWPRMNNSNVACNVLVLIHIFICLIMMTVIMIPCTLFVIFEKANIKLKLSAIGPLLYRLMGSVNYWMLLKRSSDIRKLIRHMEEDWKIIHRIEDREVMLQYAKFGRSVAGICGVIMHGGAFLFSIARAIKTVPITVGNKTLRMHPMTCPIYSQIIDIRFSPVNEIALIMQFLSTFIVSSSTVGACSLAAVFAMHACGQLNVLCTWLRELVENQKGNQTAEQKLAAIVEHHLRILTFIARVESIMNKISLVELMGCTINMCLLGYYLIMAWEDFDATKITSYVNVYFSMAFNIFIFCYIGEIITEQCKHIGEVAYMTNWYNLHHKTALGLILIIARSSNVIKITAGKIFHLSIATYGDVMRTSMVYLNLLRTLTIVQIFTNIYPVMLDRSPNSFEDRRRRFSYSGHDELSIRGQYTVRFHVAIMSNSKRAPESDISKKYNDYSLQLNRWLIKPIGAWPQINASSLAWRIFILLQILICASLVASVTVPCLLYVLFEKVNVKLKLNALGPLIHRLMGSINYWVLLNRSNDIYKLMRHMEVDWNRIQKIDNRKVMLQYAKFGRFITMICGMIMQGGTFIFSLTKALKTTTIVIGNETYTTYPMTCPIYSKIIDIRFSPVNEIALVLQFLSTFIVSSSTVGACSLAAVFVTHACGQLNVMYAWLHELVENQEKGNHAVKRKLATIVEQHLRTLSFLSRVESIMHKVSFVELTGCTINMCLIGYYVIMAWEMLDTAKIMSLVMIYFSMGFNIFIFCYIGEIVTEQCKYVGEMAYMTDWYNLHHKTARSLILIIARSSNVIKITAGKLFQLSIVTFGDVMKTSVVYLNLLRTLT